MRKHFTLALVVLLSMTSLVGACGFLLFGVPEELREREIERMRQLGPAGLTMALGQLKLIEEKLQGARAEERPQFQEELTLIKQVVDKVAGQRDAHVSRLYWYTDLEKAKSASAESGKPVLSLRMLGNLTDEFSCANSRFFRTALYANEEISAILRENFVLHWKSVRPVPKVTIDFGDGRKLERTVTGNSAHYVLSAEGIPLDVLPGLFSPHEFKIWLERVQVLATSYNKTDNESARTTVLRRYHDQRRRAIESEWTTAIKQVAPDLMLHRPDRPSTDLIYVDAVEAAHRAMSKRGPELPILRAIHVGPEQTDRMVTDKLWTKLAQHYRGGVKLDKQSVNLIQAERPNARADGAFALSKSVVENPILRLVRNFEDSLALDTVRNKFLLEREIHNWYVDNQAPTDFDQLNEKVYAELFLTPSNDPWLGLIPVNTYTALDNNGIVSTIPLTEIGAATSLE